TKLPDLRWRAYIPTWPDCRAEGSTREEALTRVKHQLAEVVSHSEIVRVDLGQPDDGILSRAERDSGDEWSDYGIFSGDPTWRELFTGIEANRNSQTTEE